MLAAEAVGAMSAAMDVTTDYLKNRRQFGRTIASFQAVQHRLAECKVLLEGARWLVYEAAALDAPAEQAALAAAHALSTAGRVFVETHQLSGAIGFTHEHDLHVWSMRLQALRLELGGTASHRRAVSLTRWMAEA
jgi:alkylation response protein AidB-like acyl-CoA dehydrogenase